MTQPSASTVCVYKPNLRKRIIATILDYTVFIFFICLYITIFGEDNGTNIKSVNGIMTLPIIIFWYLYFVIIEAVLSASPGHALLHLKVLTLDRTEINRRHAGRRHCVDLIDIFFYGIPAIIIIKNTEKHQRLGDLLAHTIVVDVTDPEQYNITGTTKTG